MSEVRIKIKKGQSLIAKEKVSERRYISSRTATQVFINKKLVTPSEFLLLKSVIEDDRLLTEWEKEYLVQISMIKLSRNGIRPIQVIN